MKVKSPTKFSDPAHCESLVWQMRLADLPRAENRVILNRTFNGDPPFSPATAEENNVEVNRNFLEGTGNLTDARTQWNNNFLAPGDKFSIHLDSGPVHKKNEYAASITKHINRGLKRSLPMINQARETGAGVLLHGIGPSTWQDRRSPVPKVVPISSLLIPSETDIDFENLEYFAIFRELTPSQLYEKTHGPKVDPGWNMPLVMQELKFVAEQVQKQTNMATYQFMPERVEEVIKQDIGFWGSDAVPTIDYWDFYYREMKDSSTWCRKIFLDWQSGGRDVDTSAKFSPKDSPNGGQWLYDSKGRKYASSWQEIIHCNFGDCSCVAPFKYHSVRSLGWMIWGIVDIGNRLQCKMTEQAFSDLMWFFRVAGQNDFNRIKKANFLQMGVIPQGIDWVKGNERFSPDPKFIQMVLEKNRQLMSAHSSSYTRNAERQDTQSEKTATQVMAEVNSINTMVSGVMNMAYTYENFKYREICRRFCIPNNPDPMVRKFRKACLDDGVPLEYLDIEKWDIEPERAMGAGNKTVQMAIVQYLNTIRQNLGPEAQRKVDHIGIRTMTEDVAMAEDLAPIKGQQAVSKSTHDAELATDRLMLGLPFTPTPQMIYEDYVLVWLRDMGLIVKQIQSTDNVGTQEQMIGLQNMAAHIGAFLQIMAQDETARGKVRQYSDLLGQLTNVIKGFSQRLAEQVQAGNGNGAMDETQAKLQSDLIMAQAKAANSRESHAQKTAQKQTSFELEQQRKDRELEADIRRQATSELMQTAADIRKQGREQIEKQNNPTE